MTEKPFNYKHPDWKPLERAVQAAGLPLSTCGEFMWMGEWKQGQHSYKHRDTRGYAVLTQDEDATAAGQRVRKARVGWQSGAA